MSTKYNDFMTHQDYAGTTNALDDFDRARALLVSYAMEGADDSRLPEILMRIRETCGPDAFNRILVLAAAIDDSQFHEYCADVLPILRDLEITADLKADAEALLHAMCRENEQALREAQEEADPYRCAAVRLYSKFRSPNLAQVLRELERL